MKIGVVGEIKDQEHRVALTPAGAGDLVQRGHSVLVQAAAGSGAGFDDDAYSRAGAKIVSVREAWATDLVLKVKEPLEIEYPFLGQQVLFTYLHLSGVERALTETLLARRTTAIAYETVEDAEGSLPLLAPMSGVAGNMAVTMGNFWLAHHNHGKGSLLGQVMGRRYGKVVVIGDGVVGRHAARTAEAMGAHVYLLGRHPEREAELKSEIGETITFVLSNPDAIALHCRDADLLVGTVLRRGARTPMIVTETMVETMQPGSVIVDVSIDQGGCVETARPTTHARPVYREHGVIHYGVANMPGAYLPGPIVEKQSVDADASVSFHWFAPEKSIGRVSTFGGNFGMILRAYVYILMHGAVGLRQNAVNAVLNANYLRVRLREVYSVPFDRMAMHEFVCQGKISGSKVHATDISKRLMDFGIHPPTNYFPLIVREALMIEPTETESKPTLDAFIDAMLQIAEEARSNPERLLEAPHTTPIRRLDEVHAARHLLVTDPHARPDDAG